MLMQRRCEAKLRCGGCKEGLVVCLAAHGPFWFKYVSSTHKPLRQGHAPARWLQACFARARHQRLWEMNDLTWIIEWWSWGLPWYTCRDVTSYSLRWSRHDTLSISRAPNVVYQHFAFLVWSENKDKAEGSLARVFNVLLEGIALAYYDFGWYNLCSYDPRSSLHKMIL